MCSSDLEDVEGVRSVRIPGGDSQVKLILTGDQNLVDLSYIVRWNIKDLEGYKFRVVDPIETVNEAAEAAMRASVAETELDETFSGQGRAAIELDVRERMQATLDSYGAGVRVLGVEIEKADPPAQVVDAFRDVRSPNRMPMRRETRRAAMPSRCSPRPRVRRKPSTRSMNSTAWPRR